MEHQQKLKKLALMLAAVFMAAVCVIPHTAVEARAAGTDRIHFLKVGGSNAFLVESGGKTMLMDASNPEKADYADAPEAGHGSTDSGAYVAAYLKSIGITHLDYVIGTHSHWDHIGGMPNVAASSLTDSRTVYIYKGYKWVEREEKIRWHNQGYYEKAVKAFENKKAVMARTDTLDSRTAGKLGISLTKEGGPLSHMDFRLGSFDVEVYNLYTQSTSNENLNSMVVYLSNGTNDALFMADMETGQGLEQKLVSEITRKHGKISVYQVGHHGSVTSTAVSSVMAAKPDIAVVSSKARSDSAGFLNAFKTAGTKTYWTCDSVRAIVIDMNAKTPEALTYKDSSSKTPSVKMKTGDPANSKKDGWKRNTSTNEWTYSKNGILQTGWITYKSDKYYIDPSTYTAATGWKKISGSWYLFEESNSANRQGAMKTGWQKVSGKWYYLEKDGKMASGWKTLNGKTYYLSGSGAMVTGIQNIAGKKYCFDASGAMKTGWQKVSGKWYYFESSGAGVTGWKKLSWNKKTSWYYFDSNGVMLTGWQKLKDSKGTHTFYLGGDGAMRTGEQVIDGKKYKFDNSGYLQSGSQSSASSAKSTATSGWQKVSGKWKYAESGGQYATGLKKIAGKHYYFAADGVMQTGWQYAGGRWYYFAATGEAKTGWQKLPWKNKVSWYYFDGNGTMLTGWQKLKDSKGIHTFYLGGDGVMRTGNQVIGGKKYRFSASGYLQ